MTARAAPSKSLLARAFPRWAVGALFFCGAALLYLHHPYYADKSFAPWRLVFRLYFWGFGLLGLPYIMAALARFAPSPRADRGDTLLLLVGVLARIRRVIEGGPRAKGALPLPAPMKSALLGLLVKGFFLPLMVGFFLGHLTAVSNGWAALMDAPPPPLYPAAGGGSVIAYAKEVLAGLPALLPTGAALQTLLHPSTWAEGAAERGFSLATDGVFLVDCGVALLGYGAESRFLGNKTKSVEPTTFGWMIALFCYPPFNGVLGTYLPMGGKPLITARPILLALRAATLAFYGVYAWATVAFGLSFSNLTNRGIITRGPYRFLRHPAYVCKGIAWWLEQVPNLDVGTAISLVGINVVYALRAYTEERHLRRDPAYQAYRAKVPWVLIPGLF